MAAREFVVIDSSSGETADKMKHSSFEKKGFLVILCKVKK